jgi:hypothetical protein
MAQLTSPNGSFTFVSARPIGGRKSFSFDTAAHMAAWISDNRIDVFSYIPRDAEKYEEMMKKRSKEGYQMYWEKEKTL